LPLLDGLDDGRAGELGSGTFVGGPGEIDGTVTGGLIVDGRP